MVGLRRTDRQSCALFFLWRRDLSEKAYAECVVSGETPGLKAANSDTALRSLVRAEQVTRFTSLGMLGLRIFRIWGTK